MLLLISSDARSRASSSTSIGTWPDSQRVRVARAVAGAAGPTGSVASKWSISSATTNGRGGAGRMVRGRGLAHGGPRLEAVDPAADYERSASRFELGEQVGVLVAEHLAVVHQARDHELQVTAPADERDVGWHDGLPRSPLPASADRRSLLDLEGHQAKPHHGLLVELHRVASSPEAPEPRRLLRPRRRVDAGRGAFDDVDQVRLQVGASSLQVTLFRVLVERTARRRSGKAR